MPRNNKYIYYGDIIDNPGNCLKSGYNYRIGLSYLEMGIYKRKKKERN